MTELKDLFHRTTRLRMKFGGIVIIVGLVILLVPTGARALDKYPELEIKQKENSEGNIAVDLIVHPRGKTISGVSTEIVFDKTELKLTDYRLTDSFPTVIVEPIPGEMPINLLVAISPESKEIKADSVVASLVFQSLSRKAKTEVSLEKVMITSLQREDNLVPSDYKPRFVVVLSKDGERKESIFSMISIYVGKIIANLFRH